MLTDLQRADIYERAADYIEEYGWTTGRLMDPDTGEVCLSGAIATVINPNLVQWKPGHRYTEREHDKWMQATATLVEFVEPFDDIIDGHNYGSTRNPIAWNNRHAKDQYEVIDLLRHAAKELRNA